MPAPQVGNSDSSPDKPEYYRVLFEAAREGLVLVDDQGIYVDVNQAYADLLGAARQNVVGHHFSEFVPPERLAEAQAAFADLIQNGEGLPEFPLRAADGTLVDCEWTVRRHFFPGLSLCSARDIRARKRAQEAIRASEAKFRLLTEIDDTTLPLTDPEEIVTAAARLLAIHLNADSICYCHFEPDREHFLVTGEYRREGAHSMLGRYTLSQFGTAVGDALKANLAFVVENMEADPPPGAALEAYRALGIRAHLAVPLQKAGRLVAAFGVQQFSARKWRPEELELLQLVANRCWEAIERAQAQAGLRRQKQLLDTLFASLPDLICTFDRNGRYTFANPALLTVWRRPLEEIIGKNTFDIGYPPNLAGRLQAEVQQVIETGHPVRNQTPYATGDDHARIYEYIFSPVFGADGSVETVTCTARDLTERQRAEAALAESEERFRMAQQAAELGLYDFDLLTRAVRCDARLRQIWGLLDDQPLTSESLFEALHPEDAPAVTAAVERAFDPAGAGLFNSEYRVINRIDRRVRWVLSLGRTYFAEGRAVRLVGTVQDITRRKTDEMALRQSEERFRALAEQITDGIFVADSRGRFRNANRAAAEMLGYTVPELLSIGIPDVLHREELARLPEQFERLASGGMVQGDWRHRRKDGSVFLGEVTGRRLPDGQLQCVVRDVTERRSAEEASRQSAEMFRFVSERAKAGHWDWDLASGRLEWSPVMRDLMRIPGNEEATFDRFLTVVQPEDRERVQEAVRRRLATPDAPEYDTEFRVVWPDGAVRWIHAKGDAIFENGKAIRMAGIAIDVTERKRTEEALREIELRLRDSKAQFRTLVETVPLLVWACGPGGECDYLSSQWVEYTGRPAAEQLGYRWLEFVHPEDRERLMARWREAVASGELFDVEFRLLGKDGVHRWFKTRARPQLDSAGKIVRWFGTNTDISELKQVEEQLRGANLDLEQFAYSASHDLQEPLRTVKIYSQLLNERSRHKLDRTELQYLDFMCIGATRMEQLVRDLLTYTQATSPEKPSPTDASAALEAALEGISSSIAESRAEIRWDDLPIISVNSTHLQLLFQNLVSNAIKYRRKEAAPEIRICACREPGSWLFSVSDNGIGIDPEYRERIFGLFKRLHTHDEYSGAGIGLAICQRIVERYRGRIWVDSELGKGSTFYFSLPV